MPVLAGAGRRRTEASCASSIIVVELRHRDGGAPPAPAQLRLEQEAAVDVDDDLASRHEVHVEQREPLGRVVRRARRMFSNSSVSQKIDAVSASAIGVRRCIGVRSGERDVVERVAELVRERRHGVVAAVEVHHHAAHVAVDTGAVRAAALPVADLGVDPLLGERARRRAPARSVEKPANASRTSSVASLHVTSPALPDRREQVPPGQARRRGRARPPWRGSIGGSRAATRHTPPSSRRASPRSTLFARRFGSRSSA